MKEKEKLTPTVLVKDLRPYEKFVKMGAESLTDAELLAIILRTGTKDLSAIDLALKVLEKAECGKQGLLGLYHLSLEQLEQIKGVGPVKAIKVKCITELSKRIATTNAWNDVVFQRSGTVAACYMEKLRHRGTECVLVLLLDAKGHLIKEKELSNGTVRMSLISPREVFIEALKVEAVQMILIHNHPSGDPSPSKADVIITEHIQKLGKQMELPLIDHIIIGDNKYISFKEQGLL